MTVKEALAKFPTDIRTEYRKPREAQAFQAGIEFVLKWLEATDEPNQSKGGRKNE